MTATKTYSIQIRQGGTWATKLRTADKAEAREFAAYNKALGFQVRALAA